MSRAAKRGPGRPALISRDKIAQAALEIGLQNVTIKRVARHLGVDHSSLYGHVKSREDLLLVAVEKAIDRLEWPMDTGDWQSYLDGLARAIWDSFQKTPGMASLFQSPDFTPESGVLGYCNAVIGLAAFGFDEDDAMIIVDSIFDMTADTVAVLDKIPEKDQQEKDWQEVFGQWEDFMKANPAHAHIMIRTMQRIEANPKEWWEKKLKLLIEGAKSYAPR